MLEEIKVNLKNNPGLKCLIVMDDTFTLGRERIEEFCRGMTELRKERDLVWYCECHVGRIRDFMDILPAMIDAGLIRLQIGIESGDQNVIDQYNKHVKIDDIVEFVTYAADCGLAQIATNFIVGARRKRRGDRLADPDPDRSGPRSHRYHYRFFTGLPGDRDLREPGKIQPAAP